MIGAIKQFFDKHIAAPSAATVDDHRLQVATSAILIEMTRADFDVHPEELAAVARAVRTAFGVSAAEIEELLQLAEEEVRRATDYYQFTSLINKGFSPEDKARVIELMWDVAYADSRVDKYEDHLVRKIAGLLHVPHKEFIAAKHRARTKREHA
ncbi:MAG: TerB family tellurite resistance protein [Acidiferrobacterales bacterium]